ncbi:MAG: HutD family protein [Sedimentitalea sp.]|nr:HutD family protein [Sedimentitalea sp.]
MSLRLIRLADLVEVPWKNGGGVTREIARQDADGALVWRLSMADVATDGPFSDFAGMTRILTVVQGGGMTLCGPEGDLDAAPGVPVTFDGGTPIVSRLKAGPLRDLNLIFDPARCTGRVRVLNGPGQDSHPCEPGATLGVHCMAGDVAIGAVRLGPGDTVLSDGAPLRLALGSGAAALLIDLVPVP